MDDPNTYFSPKTFDVNRRWFFIVFILQNLLLIIHRGLCGSGRIEDFL